ncbi:hypothetical protein J057_00754 [Marinobacter nanhaiticus D15-8W]|uniref:Addiction module antidote protein, HigA family n=2 Tax=Marinobacter TaxID=2742 RepID=N6W3N7_9GAMM|nr:hypothetical protein J057_00754 [Marinobacter nanhaiticus D15-8W]
MIAEYVNSQGLNKTELVKRLGLARVNFYALMRGDLRVTPKWAVALEKELGFDAEQMLEAQAEYDLWKARVALQEYRAEQPVPQSKQMSFAMA